LRSLRNRQLGELRRSAGSIRPRWNPIPFCGSPLDREGVRRRDRAWLDARLADPASRFPAVWQAKPLLKREPRALAWAKREFFDDLEAPEPVFLGSGDGVAHFAVDVSAVEKPEWRSGSPTSRRSTTCAPRSRCCPRPTPRSRRRRAR
jgi:hypothetical protein